jgi:lipopolysaccharide export system protein LptA
VAAAPQAPAGSLHPAKPLNIAADEVVVDNAGGGLTARGHVRLTYGAQVATADLLRLNRAARTAELSGHAVVTDPGGRVSGDAVTLYLTPANQVGRIVVTGHAAAETRDYALSADRIVADRRAGRLLAEGHVNAFAAPDLLVTGDRAMYDPARQYAVLSGHPVAENKAGRVQGDRIEMFRAQHRAVVHGPVEAEVYGATITADQATVDFTASTAAFAGHVTMARRQGTLWADLVTIFYDARRLVAQGATRVHLNDLGEGSAP